MYIQFREVGSQVSIMNKISKDILKQIYVPRPVSSHKYDFGLLLVIGGGEFYTGSPALSAMAAFRAGVDMVQVLAPKRAADIIASFSPNLAAFPLKGDWLDQGDLGTLLSFTASAKTVAGEKTAVVIGGGTGRSKETKEALQTYLQEADCKIAIDADAIHALSLDLQAIKGKQAVITPNSHEFFILTGKKIFGLSVDEKAAIIQQEAARIGCVILLKGATDVISNGKETVVDESGTAFMTVGGTGDTLAGIVGSLLAQGAEPFLAAQAASYINGRAGELASKKFGPAMLATDLIEEIANVIKP